MFNNLLVVIQRAGSCISMRETYSSQNVMDNHGKENERGRRTKSQMKGLNKDKCLTPNPGPTQTDGGHPERLTS